MSHEPASILDFFTEVYEELADSHYYNRSKPFDTFSPPHAGFKRLLLFLHFAIDTMHDDIIGDYFKTVYLLRENVFKLSTMHCYSMCERFTNIVVCILYCCSFNYTLCTHCQLNDMPGFTELAPGMMKAVYDYILQIRLRNEGGWDEVYRYCQPDNRMNILAVLDFINQCYSQKGFMTSLIPVSSGTSFFGNIKLETIHFLKCYVTDVQDFAFEVFGEEVVEDENFKPVIREAFDRIRLALIHSAPYFNRIAARNVLVSPMWEEYLATYRITNPFEDVYFTCPRGHNVCTMYGFGQYPLVRRR